MGRRVKHIPSKKQVEELGQGLRSDNMKTVFRAKIVYVYLINPDATFASVSKRLHCAETQVVKWVRRFKAAGLAGLQDLPRSGRRKVTSYAEAMKVKKQLKKQNLPCSYADIAKVLGISHDTVYRRLHVDRFNGVIIPISPQPKLNLSHLV